MLLSDHHSVKSVASQKIAGKIAWSYKHKMMFEEGLFTKKVGAKRLFTLGFVYIYPS